MNRHRSLILVAGLSIAAVVAACGQATTPGWTFAPPASSVPAGGAGASPSPSPVASQTATGGGQILGTIEVSAAEFAFTPAAVTVPAAGRYTVNFMNKGTIPHDVTFADGTTGKADPGKSVTMSVVVPESGLTFICSVPGHATPA